MQLDLHQLACQRGGRLVVRDVSLTLRAGEALVVTGRNGTGKSTLLAALAGLLRPASGSIALSGVGNLTLSECVHHLGHREGLKASLTATENLEIAARILGAPKTPPLDALADVGLSGAGGLAAAYLSAGQRRRLTLARLLVAHRPLWLLDEPTAALDQDGQAMLGALMSRHLREGGMIVASTHGPLPLASVRELALTRIGHDS